MEKLNEFELSRIFAEHFKIEDYEKCQEVKNEVDKRIANNSLDKNFMNAFRNYNPKTKSFEGEPKFGDVNGLFDNYIYS